MKLRFKMKRNEKNIRKRNKMSYLLTSKEEKKWNIKSDSNSKATEAATTTTKQNQHKQKQLQESLSLCFCRK